MHGCASPGACDDGDLWRRTSVLSSTAGGVEGRAQPFLASTHEGRRAERCLTNELLAVGRMCQNAKERHRARRRRVLVANLEQVKRRRSRAERITVRFDDAEAQRLRAYAVSMGVGPSTLVRAATLDAIESNGSQRVDQIGEHAKPEQSVATEDRDERRRLRTEVNRLGVLFNQTVRRVNIDGASALNDEGVLEQLVEVGQVVREVQEMLGGTRWP